MPPGLQMEAQGVPAAVVATLRSALDAGDWPLAGEAAWALELMAGNSRRLTSAIGWEGVHGFSWLGWYKLGPGLSTDGPASSRHGPASAVSLVILPRPCPPGPPSPNASSVGLTLPGAWQGSQRCGGGPVAAGEGAAAAACSARAAPG